MGLQVEHTTSSVVVRLGPIDALLSLKGRLDIPRDQIESIEVEKRSEVPWAKGIWFRAPGTHIPGLLRYGSYGVEPNREFWLVRRQDRVVVVEVRNWAYHRVILGSTEPETLAAELAGGPPTVDD